MSYELNGVSLVKYSLIPSPLNKLEVREEKFNNPSGLQGVRNIKHQRHLCYVGGALAILGTLGVIFSKNNTIKKTSISVILASLLELYSPLYKIFTSTLHFDPMVQVRGSLAPPILTDKYGDLLVNHYK